MADWEADMMFDLEALCREVEKHPLLYDPDRRDLSKRGHTWRAIASAMNSTPEACKRHWRSVRDRYVREDRLAKLAGIPLDDDDERTNKWSLYKHLGFLKAYKARARPQSVSSREGRPRKRAVLERNEPRLAQSKHVQVMQPFQPLALQTVQVQPMRLQAVELQVAQHYPGEEQKTVIEENHDLASECSILHPDAITQSVLLSMVNVPPPDEVIIPDQPPSTLPCEESTAYRNFPGRAETHLFTGRDREEAAQKSFHMHQGAVQAVPSESTRSPPTDGSSFITVKQEPGVETKEGLNNPEDGGQGSSDSAAPQTFHFTPLKTAKESRRQRTAGSTDGHRTIVFKPRKRRRHDSQYGGFDNYDINGNDDDGANGDDDNSTDALLRELTTATERLNARAEHVAPCRLQHVDPEDSDTMYLLSLRERLRRFGPKQKSLALVRIQEILHEIEFGEPTS